MKDLTQRDADFFPSCHPRNFLDLRALSINLHPRLEQVASGLSLAEFRIEHAKDALGMHLDSQVTAREHYGMQRLGGNAIDSESPPSRFLSLAYTVLETGILQVRIDY